MGTIKNILGKSFLPEPRDCVICFDIPPEGQHYFQGIHEVKLPGPRQKGGITSGKFNIWIPHYAALKDHVGFFTRTEAEFFHSVIDLEGCTIKTKKQIEREIQEKEN